MGRLPIDKNQIIFDLAKVFREHGFHGATLSKLVEGSGLERASLYHHFPKGKSDMAKAVLLSALSTLDEDVLSTLRETLPANKRLSAMIQAIQSFYSEGNEICFITIFSLGEKSKDVKLAMEVALKRWETLLTKCLKELKVKNSQKESQNIISSIQGSLILSNALGNNKPFKNCVYGLKKFINN